MDEMELAQLFINYKKASEQLKFLEASIQQAILLVGESRSVAGVKATYYKPSTEYDYEAAAKAANVPTDVIMEMSTVKYIPRWKEIAEHMGADIEQYKTEKPARVVVK